MSSLMWQKQVMLADLNDIAADSMKGMVIL